MDEVRRRAKDIFQNSVGIETLKDEKDIREILNHFIENGNDGKYNLAILDEIEEKLKEKEEKRLLEEDKKFIKELAQSLREQEVRKSDIADPTLFKIKNSLGEDTYFLTRKKLTDYRKNNKDCGVGINIPRTNCIELSRLLEIVKKYC